MNTAPARRHSGVSLIESLITLVIIALTLGLTLPSFEPLRARKGAEGAGAQFETDVQLARSLAVARNQSVRIGFEEAGGASCYVVHSGSRGACSCLHESGATCTRGAEALRVVYFGPRDAVQLQSNSPSMLIDATRGTVTPTATVKVLVRGSDMLHQVINIMGRVRSCSPSAVMPGYARC